MAGKKKFKSGENKIETNVRNMVVEIKLVMNCATQMWQNRILV
jgi:hypothetical protein